MKSPTHMLRDSAKIFTKHWSVLVIVTIIPVIFGAFAEGAVAAIKVISNIVYGYNSNMAFAVVLALISVAAIVIVQLINVVISLLFRIAIPRTIVSLKNKKRLHAIDIYRESWKFVLPFIVISILAGMIILPAAILFVIPSLILGVYLSFTIYAFVALNKRGIDALAFSFHLVRNRFWRVTGRLIAPLIGFLVLAAVPITLIVIGEDTGSMLGEWFMAIGAAALIIMFVLTTPVFSIYKYQLFNALIDEAPNYTIAESKKNRTLVKRFVVVGLILSVLAAVGLITCAVSFGMKYVDDIKKGDYPSFVSEFPQGYDQNGFGYGTDQRYGNYGLAIPSDISSLAVPVAIKTIGYPNYGAENRSGDSVRFHGVGISFDVPKGWYSFETNDESDTQIVLKKGKMSSFGSNANDLYNGSIYVTTKGISAADEGKSGYQILLGRQSGSAGTISTLTGIVSHSVGSAQRGDDTAGILDLDIVSNTGGKETGLRSKSFVTVEGGNVHTIVAIDDVADYPALEAVLEQIVKTLEFPEMNLE